MVPLFICLFGLVLEAVGGFYQQDVRASLKPTSFQFMLMTSSYAVSLSLLTCTIASPRAAQRRVP